MRDDGSIDCILPSFLICAYRTSASGREIRLQILLTEVQQGDCEQDFSGLSKSETAERDLAL